MNENIDNKEKILQCALELFSLKGYESVSVQEIVSMAGVTKPTLYYYFNSKEGVYDSLLERSYKMLNKVLKNAVVYNPEPELYFEDVYPVLIKVTSEYFNFAVKNEKIYRMILANLFQPSSSVIYEIINKYHFKQYEMINKMFKNMSDIHKNMLDKENIMTWSFIGIINSFIGLYYNNQIILDKEMTELLVKQFMHGIFS